MEKHRGSVRRAFIGQLVIFVKHGPRSGNAATQRMIGLVLIKRLRVMTMEDVHGEERLIESGLPTFGELSDFPKRLQESPRVF